MVALTQEVSRAFAVVVAAAGLVGAVAAVVDAVAPQIFGDADSVGAGELLALWTKLVWKYGDICL